MGHYLHTLADATSHAWNRFWFTPVDPAPLGLVRMASGGLLLVFLLTLTPADLMALYGPHGYLPLDVVGELVSSEDLPRWSHLAWLQQPWEFALFHWLAIGIAVLITVGVSSRVTTPLGWLIVVSYLWRAPMVATEVTPILALLLLYASLGPCGAAFSLDAWWARRRDGPRYAVNPSWMANLALRLMQVHLALAYLMMGLEKASSTAGAWTSGLALWWMMARTEPNVLDLTGWAGMAGAIQIVGFLVPWVQLGFAVLVWKPLLRPLMLSLTVPLWLILGLAGGQWLLATCFLAGNLAFLSGGSLRKLLGDGSGLAGRLRCQAFVPPLTAPVDQPASRPQTVTTG